MRYTLVALSVLALAGCVSSGPAPTLYKPGATKTETQAALDDCRVESLAKVPQAMATDVSPGFSSPGTLQCNTVGNYTSCNRVGAVNIPASATTYDVNQPLRGRIIDRCLAAKGYKTLVLPRCTSEQASAIRASGKRPSPPTCTIGDTLD